MLPLGSFAHSLTSPHEVAAALIGVLADVDADTSAGYRLRYRDIEPRHKAEMNRLIAGLVRQLGKHTPEFTYVGHRIDDPSVWGVWVDLGLLHAAEERGQLVQVGSHSKRPTKGTYILDLEGKAATLYRRKGMVEIWRTT